MVELNTMTILLIAVVATLQIGLNIYATYRWLKVKKVYPESAKVWWLPIIWLINIFGALAYLIIGVVDVKEDDKDAKWD